MKENPFLGMSSEDIEGFVQMYHDYKKLKEELPQLRQQRY
jgi:hypothetical protein